MKFFKIITIAYLSFFEKVQSGSVLKQIAPKGLPDQDRKLFDQKIDKLHNKVLVEVKKR